MNSAAVRFDHALACGQTQSAAAAGAGAGWIDPVQLVEDPFQLLVRHAFAIVLERDAQAAVLNLAAQPEIDRGTDVNQCVMHDVREHPSYFFHIQFHMDILRHLTGPLQPRLMRLQLFLVLRADALDEASHMDPLCRDFERVMLHVAEGGEILDQLLDIFRFPVNNPVIVLFFGLGQRLASGQPFHIADNGGERRLDVMRDGRDHIDLLVVGRFQSLSHFREILHQLADLVLPPFQLGQLHIFEMECLHISMKHGQRLDDVTLQIKNEPDYRDDKDGDDQQEQALHRLHLLVPIRVLEVDQIDGFPLNSYDFLGLEEGAAFPVFLRSRDVAAIEIGHRHLDALLLGFRPDQGGDGSLVGVQRHNFLDQLLPVVRILLADDLRALHKFVGQVELIIAKGESAIKQGDDEKGEDDFGFDAECQGANPPVNL